MPVLKKSDDSKKCEWVMLVQTKKQVLHTDDFVLGHPEIPMPAIVSSSNIKGVKARVVSVKNSKSNKPPSSTETSNVNVIHEWTFDEDDQTKPVYFNPPVHINTDFWVEMCNPTKQDAVVSAVVQGLYRSKSI
jgi:hypothetical protein